MFHSFYFNFWFLFVFFFSAISASLSLRSIWCMSVFVVQCRCFSIRHIRFLQYCICLCVFVLFLLALHLYPHFANPNRHIYTRVYGISNLYRNQTVKELGYIFFSSLYMCSLLFVHHWCCCPFHFSPINIYLFLFILLWLMMMIIDNVLVSVFFPNIFFSFVSFIHQVLFTHRHFFLFSM